MAEQRDERVDGAHHGGGDRSISDMLVYRRMNPQSESTTAPLDRPRRLLSMSTLLAALILLIAASAFIDSESWGDLTLTILLTIVLLAALVAISARRRAFVLALTLVTSTIIAHWLDLFRPGLLPAGLYAAIGIACMACIIVALVKYILRAPRVTLEVIFAGIAGYLMLAIVWGTAYELIARITPGAFAFNSAGAENRMSPFRAVYFSFSALSTLGIGDIVPLTKIARLLVVLEATTGTFYMTVLIARLVGLYSPHNRSMQSGL